MSAIDIERAIEFFVKSYTGDRKAFCCINSGETAINFGDNNIEINQKDLSDSQMRDVIQWAVSNAYKDTKRTCKGIGNKPYNNVKKDALKSIEDKIFGFFNHKNKQESVKDIMNIWTTAFAGSAYDDFGKAQKIVNMAFKYLYCLEYFRENYKDVFKDCHMPLDRYTIAWIKDKDICPDGIKWSKLTEENYDSYQEKVECRIKKDLGENIKLSHLEAEFIIWDFSKIREMNHMLKRFIESYKEYPFKEMIPNYINTSIKNLIG